MPRVSRQGRDGGIQHVVVQGMRDKKIFGSEILKERYLKRVMAASEETGIEVIAFCILTNHAHLLVAAEDKSISVFMRRINAGFANDYRKLKVCEGPVFRDRYRSEKVDSEEMLLQTIRYIHREPLKEDRGISLHEYRWSSSHYYVEEEDSPVVREEIGDHVAAYRVREALSVEGGYLSYMNAPRVETEILDEVPLRYGRTDEEAREVIARHMGGRDFQEFFHLTREEQKDILKLVRRVEPVSILQLERICGIGRGIIQRL